MNNGEFFCLYCNKPLVKKPLKKTKCSHCGNFLYVRTKNSKQEVVSETEAKRLDALKDLSGYGITELDYSKHKEVLAKRFGKEPNYHDVIWSLYNDLIIRGSNNFQTLNSIYYQMALFLRDEGKPYNDILRLKHKMDLLEYQQSNVIIGVDIDTSACCSKCRPLNRKEFSIEAALEEKLLPYEKCEGFCMCCYLPLTELSKPTRT